MVLTIIGLALLGALALGGALFIFAPFVLSGSLSQQEERLDARLSLLNRARGGLETHKERHDEEQP